MDCPPCEADVAGIAGASRVGLGFDGAAEVRVPRRRGDQVKSGQARPAQPPSAVGRSGPHAPLPGLPVPGGRHGDGHGMAGVDGGCAALACGAQGVAQPVRSRLGPRCGEELA